MGLNLEAVSKNYDECDYECFSELYCGYITFKIFRDKLIEFCTNKKYDLDNVLKLTNNNLFVYDCDCYIVALKNNFNKEELEEKDVQAYIKGLEYIEIHYPLLYKVWAFVNHCDCDGRMDSEQLVDALPVLKLFLQYLEKNYDKDNVMIKICKELIVVFNDCINNKGILLFS